MFSNEIGLNKPKNKPCRLCSAMREDWTNQRTLCILCSAMREDWTNQKTNLADFVQQWERTEQTKEQTCAYFVQQWERTEQTLQTLFNNERGLNKPKNKPVQTLFSNERGLNKPKNKPVQTLFSNEIGLNKPKNKPCRLCSAMRGLNKPKNKPCRLCSAMGDDWTNKRTNLADFVQQWEDWTNQRTNLADFVQQWETTELTKEQTLQTLFSNDRGLNKPKNKPRRLCSTMREDWTNQRTNLADFVQQWERTEQTKEQTLHTLFSNERRLNKPKNKPCRLCSAMREDWTTQRTNLADFVKQWEDWTNQRTNLPDFVQQWERTEQTKEQTSQTLFSNERGLNKPKNTPCRHCSAMREDWTNQRTKLADFVQQWERTEQTKEQNLQTLFSNERGLNKPKNKPEQTLFSSERGLN